jgi:site-specific recombinase XerD
MILIPKVVYAQYLNHMKENNVPADLLQEYVKWLRYFLDFCARHVIELDKSERVRLFLEKLREKRQSNEQCQQAAHAASLYFEMQPYERQKHEATSEASLQPLAATDSVILSKTTDARRPSQFNEAGYQEQTDSPDWDEVIGKLADEIKVRHFSRKTLRTYAHWSRQFQKFLKNKSTQELTTADVKEYLTWLCARQAFPSG